MTAEVTAALASLRDPEWPANIPDHAVPQMIACLSAAIVMLSSKQMARPVLTVSESPAKRRWLAIKDAAVKYPISEAWLYRNAERLGLTGRLGKRLLIDEAKLEAYLDHSLGDRP